MMLTFTYERRFGSSRLSTNYGYPKSNTQDSTDVRAKGLRRGNIRQKINSLKTIATRLEIRISKALFGRDVCYWR